ncbi:MAG: YkgJ family cysteine cluster protein [Pyrinomonadaceae bacterium]
MKNEDLVTGNVTLLLDGEPIDLQMTVPAKAVKAQRMLPVFQQMTNSFAEMAETAVENAGEKISCQKGCGACCRQAVPLAEIEAYQIAELVENLPEPRRSEIKLRFEKALQHFYEIGWFERLDGCGGATNEEREKVVMEYFYEQIACPFLEDESCSIHETRPLVCREYLVTSPAENCQKPSADVIRRIKFPIKASDTVRKITNSENLNKAVNFVPLILAVEWAKKHADHFPEKTGEQWMADFFTNLTKSELPKTSGE